MIEFYSNDTISIPLELTILSGGTTVTGRTPYAQIRDKSTNNYFDFASRTFTSVTVSSTAPLASAIDGLYRTTWDVSGLFTTSHFLTVEYHDATALSIDDLLFRTLPPTTGDCNVTAAGGGSISIKGQWTFKEKKDLVDTVNQILARMDTFRLEALELLRDILNKKTIGVKDIKFIKSIEKRDEIMWQELLQVMKMRNDSTTEEVMEKLRDFYTSEEGAKQELIKYIDEKMKTPNKLSDVIIDDDDGEE